MTELPWLRALPCGKPISALGFGCSSLWAKPAFPHDRAMAILDALADEGVNHFDSGPSYGAGEGERRLGHWLRGRPFERLVISTKVGTNLIGGRIVRGFDPAAMEASLTGSLERLGVPSVDIVYLHGPTREDLAPALDWLEGVKQRGLARYSGVNSFDNQVLNAAIATPVDAIMLQYNIGDFRNLAALERLLAAGKLIVAGTALARGAFDPARFVPSSREKLWYLARMLRHDPAFAWRGWMLRRRIAASGIPPYEAAIRFLASDPRVLSSLFGTSSIGHARDNARAGRKTLAQEVWTRLQIRA